MNRRSDSCRCLPEHDVVGVERAGQRLQVADVARLAKERGIADDADPAGRQAGEPRDDDIRQAQHEPVVGGIAGFVVEDRRGHGGTRRQAGRLPPPCTGQRVPARAASTRVRRT